MQQRPPIHLEDGVEYLGPAGSHSEEVVGAVRNCQMFENFNDTELGTIAHYLHYFKAPVGTVLLREGHEGGYLLIIVKGKVVARKKNLHGENTTIGMAGPGEVVGEMSMIDNEPRFATCLATEETHFGVLMCTDYYELTALHPRVANKFMIMLLQMVVGRLRGANLRLVASLDELNV